MKYFIDYNKSSSASCIFWLSDEHKITECNPYIESITTEGELDVAELWGEDFVEESLDDFEALEGDDPDSFMLCYTAIVSIDLDQHEEFKEALESSDFMVEVNLGFKDQEGNVLEEVFDKNYSFTTELIEDE
tara:strand:+ start:1958 stop:2353 length:396 start_codon:yes stop_codon:yes gene_type:complete